MPAAARHRIDHWFETYSRSFLVGALPADGPLVLKIEHTERVCANLRTLGADLGLSSAHQALAEIIGRLHDVGRFEQYRRYQTFADSRSVNHAALGVRVIQENELLAGLAAGEQAWIVEAVRLHNAPQLPAGRPEPALTFLRLIRDADKLDIWKIFGDYYRQPGEPQAAIVQHLPDAPRWSPVIVAAVQAGRPADFAAMQTLNDFKLLQLGWVFDLNLAASARLALQRGDLAAIAAALPAAAEVQHAAAVALQALQRRADDGA